MSELIIKKISHVEWLNLDAQHELYESINHYSYLFVVQKTI